jgi:hypothetical protein
MKRWQRVTAPRVIDGQVLRKNNTRRSPSAFSRRERPVIERRKPGVGYRHVLRQAEVATFLELLPDWEELSEGLNAVVLAGGDFGCDGWYKPGVVALCAWERGLWRVISASWYSEHADIFEQIGVPCEELDDGRYLCRWTEPTIRAYLLLHVLTHELGHHHDRMTTRSKADCCRGEDYAEEYARRYQALIWDRYLQEFELF